MKLNNFITHLEIENISNCIKNKVDFNHEREHKGYEFGIYSTRAGVDFKDGTKKGDYIICVVFDTRGRGWGRPLSGEKLRELENANELKKYIDERLGESRIEGYERIDEGQIDLFNLGS